MYSKSRKSFIQGLKEVQKFGAFMALIWIILGLLHPFALAGTLLCSKCDSTEEPNCQTNPPVASPCREASRVNCMEATEYDQSGRQIKFIRGCTTAAAGEDCVKRGIDNITLCYKNCGTDGCNAASYISFCSISILLPVVVTSLLVWIHR